MTRDKDARIQELLETNNHLLQRARNAEYKLGIDGDNYVVLPRKASPEIIEGLAEYLDSFGHFNPFIYYRLYEAMIEKVCGK